MADNFTATNKKAYRNYELTDKWEGGIVLNGGEVKSVRAGEVNFKDSFARIEEGEVYLYNLHINPYTQASYLNDEPDRRRKLLLHRKEIARIDALIKQKSLNLVPTKLYMNARGLVKVEIALGKGKRLYDKREDIKDRALDRALKRTLKRTLKNRRR